MWDIPAGWQAVIALFASAMFGAIAWLFNTRRTDRLAESARKDAAITALQAKIDQLQTEKLTVIETQLKLANDQIVTYGRTARSLEELTNLVRAKSGVST